eukprot:gene28595-37564_t
MQSKAKESAKAKSLQQTSVASDDASFRVVEDLQSCGINVSDIKKLQEAGLHTVGSVLQVSTRDLIAIKGLTEAKVEKIKEAARKLDCRGGLFKTGLEMKEKRKAVIKMTTGSTALDKILGGGVETCSITELFAHGGQGKVIYLDTEGNFRTERIESIADRFGLDVEQTLDNIIVARVFSHEEQMDIIKPIAALLSDPNQGPFRLLIVDSIIALFRVEFSGRGELSERQQKLGQHLGQLVRIAEEFSIAVVVVNQCMADPGAMSMFGPVIKPVGGHVLAHASTTRVMLKKGKGEQRIAKIFDSPLMPEEDATFQISNGGITDIE